MKSANVIGCTCRPNAASDRPGGVGRRSVGCHAGVAAALLLAVALPAAADTVVNSLHNLSASGPGKLKASAEPEICIFCHTPHGSAGDAPLWNRFSSGVIYTPYRSSTAKARIGQPTGASRTCLSCHDGTVALGMVRSRKSGIPMRSEAARLGRGEAWLGTDLSDDHPISFTYDAALAAADGELRPPALLTGAVRLDHNRQLQCTTCHDPHDSRYDKFLVRDNRRSALCITCHDPKYWDTSDHRTSPAGWNGRAPDPWPHTEENTVADNACANCHRPHNAGTGPRLLNFASEERNCVGCHNGHAARQDVASEFSKFSVHPVLNTAGVHDPVEDLINAPRHVECVDCHNPHAARRAESSAPMAPGALAGVKGINLAGALVDPVQYEYELCFRCHGDGSQRGTPLINRAASQNNTRLEFSPGSASYHPVAAAGHNGNVPSLRSPYRTSSRIYCTDCHNNNAGPGAGGTGPRGPHGSQYAPLLERQLILADNTAESEAAYALCYKCHNRSSVLGDESFPLHRLHVVDQQAACSTCHDPHASADNTNLINFNRKYVSAYEGRLEFVDGGDRRGTCTLVCHGQVHDESAYPARRALLRNWLQKHRGAR